MAHITLYTRASVPGGHCNAKWEGGKFYSYVYFVGGNSTTDFYEYSTPWLLSYPKKAKSALRDAGFQILDGNPTGSCGWTLVDQIYNKGIGIGWTLHQSSTEILAPADPKVTLNARQALENTYPTLEICLSVLIPCFVFFTFCACFFCRSRY